MVGIRGVLVLACSLRAEGMKYAVGGRAISTNNPLPFGVESGKGVSFVVNMDK
jgi:hypothetical protein